MREKRFRLERSFDKYSKRASLVCLDDGEEFSLEQGDLMMLLPELDPEGYSDTLYIGQAGARTGRNLAARLKDYATNYYVTGDSELNLTAARNALDEQKKQLDRQMKEKLEKSRDKGKSWNRNLPTYGGMCTDWMKNWSG